MKVLFFLLAYIVIKETSSCYAPCTGCTCRGTCSYPRYCSGQGPDCYCSGLNQSDPVKDDVVDDFVDVVSLKSVNGTERCEYHPNAQQPCAVATEICQASLWGCSKTCNFQTPKPIATAQIIQSKDCGLTGPIIGHTSFGIHCGCSGSCLATHSELVCWYPVDKETMEKLMFWATQVDKKTMEKLIS